MENSDLYNVLVSRRIVMALASKKLSVNHLAKQFQMNQSTLNKQINGDTPLPLDTLGMLLPYLDGISAEWLLRGDGTMEKGVFNQMIGHLGGSGNGDVFQAMNTDVDSRVLQQQIKELKAEKERLLNIIEKLTSK